MAEGEKIILVGIMCQIRRTKVEKGKYYNCGNKVAEGKYYLSKNIYAEGKNYIRGDKATE